MKIRLPTSFSTRLEVSLHRNNLIVSESPQAAVNSCVQHFSISRELLKVFRVHRFKYLFFLYA